MTFLRFSAGRAGAARCSGVIWLATVAVLVHTTACGGETPATAAGAGDAASASDSAGTSDSAGSGDAVSDTAVQADAVSDATAPGDDAAVDAPDTQATADAADAPDAPGPEDAQVSQDGQGTTDAVGAEVAQPAGSLVAQDLLLTEVYNKITVTEVALPANAATAGKLRIYAEQAGVQGELLGEVNVAAAKVHSGLAVILKQAVVGEKTFRAALFLADGKPAAGIDGLPLTASFKVTGDVVDPELFVADQQVPAADLTALTLGLVRVPQRFTAGAWVAIHADAQGKPGALLGKLQLKPGDHKGVALALVSGLTKGQMLHALLREGAAGSGSWTPSAPQVQTLAGQPVQTSFAVDSEAFHPVLEIEDQTLSDPKKLLIKKVTIPKEHFGGWLAIYADNAGQEGELLGKLYYITGTKLDQTLALTVPQQGEKTLRAVLYAGQKWDEAANVVMQAPGGSPMKTTVQVGAKPLSYIIAEPYTTDNPRHVMVTRAYSYDKPAWVVLARDDNGKPGVELARKKVLKKFAGNVHLWNLTGDFLEGGSLPDYLTGKPGTFRRSARGVDKIHVQLFEESPEDGKFTYVPGGKEDQPVLDAQGQPVTKLMTVTVKSSVQNVQQDSPRYYFPCPLSQHVANATALPVDCRCHVNIVGLDFPECKADIADGLGMQIGEGPRARTHNFGGFRSGFAEAGSGELIALMTWKDHKTVWPENDVTIDVGAVMGIDLVSRKRRVISGRYEDPAKGILDVGKGPVLSYPFEVQKGPDGSYYVGSYAYVRIGASLVPTVDIIRVDPKSGDRQYVWRSNHLGFNLDGAANPWGHCANGRSDKYGYASVQIGTRAFGLDDKGNFFLSYAHNGNTPTSDGIGILKVSADGKSCDFVTRSKTGADNFLYKGKNIGQGVEPQAGPYKGMLVKDGKLYTSTELNDELYEIDIASGDRKMLHKDGVTDAHNGSSGTHVVWDAHRKLIWQAGLSGSTLMFDPQKGKGEPLWCPENDRNFMGIACVHPGAWGNNGMPMERGLWLHPSDKDYLFVVNLSMIIRVHLPSGTSEIFSY